MVTSKGEEDSGGFATRPCVLPGVQAVEARSAHHFPRHWHDAHGIGLMVSGAQRSFSGRGVVEAGAGDLITCNPGETHDGMPIGGPRRWRMLYLAPGLVAGLVGEIREKPCTHHEFTDPVLPASPQRAAFEAAYNVLLTGTAEDAQARVLLLLAQLLRARPPAAPEASALARARALIDNDPLRALTLSELAAAAGLSRFRLIRGFAALTGLTPHAYVIQRRLDKARAMIEAGAPLSGAACASGFSDQSHFTRAFARRYGITPGRLARAAR